MSVSVGATEQIEQRLLARNHLFDSFFSREALRLAEACRDMAERFLRGGRLLAFGRGPYATDAQHVSVEFVHPVIVGKRALPALDISFAFDAFINALIHPNDMVMGFGPPEGDPSAESALESATRRGAMTFALPGIKGSYFFTPISHDAFLHQELIEILYHTLWETVHVFFEYRELGHDVGASEFLYPFLGKNKQETRNVVAEVASSILMKVRDDAQLRAETAKREADNIVASIPAIRRRLGLGGKLILFGNGGSATDANDFAIDCIQPPNGYQPIPAISLSMEPANISAIANDVGSELIFQRQLIAQAQPNDVAIAISTSGNSRNIILALEAARKRNLFTVALLGYDGGEVLRGGLADVGIVVRSDYIPRIQEIHASIYHVMRELLESMRDA